MNDRELTELAAKAAGYKVTFTCLDVAFRRDEDFVGQWSPLDDDGDALRLAVRLELTVATGIRYCTVSGAHAHINEPYDGDPKLGGGVVTATSAMAATRRAIVKAAAEIGAKR